jgi:hypothetical protein
VATHLWLARAYHARPAGTGCRKAHERGNDLGHSAARSVTSVRTAQKTLLVRLSRRSSPHWAGNGADEAACERWRRLGPAEEVEAWRTACADEQEHAILASVLQKVPPDNLGTLTGCVADWQL